MYDSPKKWNDQRLLSTRQILQRETGIPEVEGSEESGRGVIYCGPLYETIVVRRRPSLINGTARIASLARRISERSVKRGLRTTLLTQAKRLERLAEARLKDFPEGAEDEDQKQD